MKLANGTYQKVNELLEKIEQSVSNGIMGEKAHDELLNIKTSVLQIRQELKNGVFIPEETGGDAA